MIEFRGVRKRFGEKQVLAGVDLRLPRGTVQFVIGTSGAGKSVLMKMVVGLVRPDEGQVLFEGRELQALPEADFFEVRRRCALVFQHATLFDSLSVLDNVALPLEKRHHWPMGQARRRAQEVLEELHLGDWMERTPAELGLGTKKRVAIARALALEPEYVIYDEPTTGLDPVAARRVDAMMLELRGRGLTQIIVSHDLRSIFGVADEIALLFEGRVHARGTPVELRASPDPVVRQFLEGRAEGPIC